MSDVIRYAITVGTGTAVHWGSALGSRCGAGGWNAAVKATQNAITCKRCIALGAPVTSPDTTTEILDMLTPDPWNLTAASEHFGRRLLG